MKSLYPLLISTALTILLAIYLFNSTNLNTTTFQSSNKTSTTTFIPSPTVKPSPLPVPILDTTNWKKYIENGKRYSYIITDNGDIKQTLSDYKKYTFKYPAEWKIASTSVSSVKITNPKNSYAIGIGYASNRDYKADVIYTLSNGMAVETFYEYGSEIINSEGEITKLQYNYPDIDNTYDIIIEKTNKISHVVSVNVPVTDKEGKIFDINDIAVGRALVKTFELAK